MRIIDRLHHWASSEYKIDEAKHGNGFNKNAMLGRATSLIDIPSQAAKVILIPISEMVAGLALLMIGAYYIGKAALLATAFEGVKLINKNFDFKDKDKDSGKEKDSIFNNMDEIEFDLEYDRAMNFQQGLEYAGLGLVTGTYEAVSDGLVHALALIGDIAGVLIPEIGRSARAATHPHN